MDILTPILTLSGLGFLFGLSLSLAAKKFCVQIDPRIEKVFSKLPGANCGACGRPGCMGFTESLIKGECEIDRCTVSDTDAKKEIAKLLGVELKTRVKKVALLRCQGGIKAKNKFVYKGVQDCIAANLVMGGAKACDYGCIGLDTCAIICPFGAISMGSDNLPKIDISKCTACGKCVEACPKKLFSLVPVDKPIYIACSSHNLGKDVMKVCPVGCITCRKCEKVCPSEAIKIIDNLAVIDYDKCNSCGECVEVCPTKVIVKREQSISIES